MANKKFLLFWGGDKTAQLVEGRDIADAMTQAGYGGGALAALDWHRPLVPPSAFPKAEFISAKRLDAKDIGFDGEVYLQTRKGGNPISSVELWKNEHGKMIAVLGSGSA